MIEDIETFLKGQREKDLLELCKNKELRNKLDKIYKVGVRFNLRKVEIVYLLKEVLSIDALIVLRSNLLLAVNL